VDIFDQDLKMGHLLLERLGKELMIATNFLFVQFVFFQSEDFFFSVKHVLLAHMKAVLRDG